MNPKLDMNHLLELGRALELVKSPIRQRDNIHSTVVLGEHGSQFTKQLVARVQVRKAGRFNELFGQRDALLAAELDNAIRYGETRRPAAAVPPRR